MRAWWLPVSPGSAGQLNELSDRHVVGYSAGAPSAAQYPLRSPSAPRPCFIGFDT
jgi:hypothetical protein